MGQLADRLRDMVVTATSPDGHITARVRGQGEGFEVSFGPGAYRGYSHGALTYQLTHLATLAFTAHRRAEQSIVDKVMATPLRDDGVDFGPERRRYLQALKELTAVGESDGGQLRLSSRGLIAWEITIDPTALDRWSERQFLQALHLAVARLLAHHAAQVFALKDDIYDLGFPDRIREAAGIGPRGNHGSLSA